MLESNEFKTFWNDELAEKLTSFVIAKCQDRGAKHCKHIAGDILEEFCEENIEQLCPNQPTPLPEGWSDEKVCALLKWVDGWKYRHNGKGWQSAILNQHMDKPVKSDSELLSAFREQHKI